MNRILEVGRAISRKKSYARVAVSTLNNWAMDFQQNKINIIRSIEMARK
jgi:hypothetical protein